MKHVIQIDQRGSRPMHRRSREGRQIRVARMGMRRWSQWVCRWTHRALCGRREVEAKEGETSSAADREAKAIWHTNFCGRRGEGADSEEEGAAPGKCKGATATQRSPHNDGRQSRKEKKRGRHRRSSPHKESRQQGVTEKRACAETCGPVPARTHARTRKAHLQRRKAARVRGPKKKSATQVRQRHKKK